MPLVHTHTLTHYEEKAASCTKAGNSEYWKCEGEDGCNKLFSDADGLTEITEIPVIAATGHTEVTDAEVEPTCETDGRTAGSHCSVCNTVITAQTIIPKLNHSWGAWEIQDEPTFNTMGKAERICGNDNTHKDNVDLPVLTDTTVWTEGLKIEPTETENGSVTYTSQYGNVQIIIPAFRDETFPYEITGLVLRDSDTLPENSDFVVKYSITQVEERNTNEYDKFFVAAYDTDGKLICISSKNVRMSVGQILHLGYLIKPNGKKVGSIKAFAWDGFNSMKPLAKTKTLTF